MFKEIVLYDKIKYCACILAHFSFLLALVSIYNKGLLSKIRLGYL